MTQTRWQCQFLTRISKYNKFGRTYLFQIDFYHLRPSKNPNESSTGDADDDEWQTKYLMDAYHTGNVSSISIDHSVY